MGNTELIRDHLDLAASRGSYLDAINGTTPESLIDAQMKMGALYSALGGVASYPILSIGVGQGEELHAIRSVFGPEAGVMGVDLSTAALERSAERSETFDLGIHLIEADASKLPIADQSVSGIVMSAILHEIFSYNQPDGVEAYEASIQEAARTLVPGGVLYIREFACPTQEAPVSLEPLTREASTFFDYFASTFKVGLDQSDAPGTGIRFDENGRLENTADLTQILLHFRNFWNDRTKDLTYIGDLGWKELSESYIIPTNCRQRYMDPHQLCDDIVRISDEKGPGLELLELSLKMRKKVNLFLAQHFKIMDSHGEDVTSRLMHAATPKLEATFRKK